MTTQSIKADKLKLTSTLGGRQGLLIRRFYHILAGALAPLLLYGYAQDLAEYFDTTTDRFYFTIWVAQAFLESLRLYYGCIFFGLRRFERSQLSSQFWGCSGVLAVLSFAPWRNHGATFVDRAYIGLPITWGLAFFDPFVGEMKVRGYSTPIRIIMSIMFCYLLWFLGWYFLDTPRSLCTFLPLIVVAAEYPNCLFVDDNILICTIPLLCVNLYFLQNHS